MAHYGEKTCLKGLSSPDEAKRNPGIAVPSARLAPD